MQTQWKVVLLVGLLVASCVTVVAWQTSQQIRYDKTALFSENAERQLAPVRRLVQAKLDLVAEQLVQFTRRKEAGATVSVGHEFDLVSLNFETQPGTWAPKWIEKREGRAARWSGNREQVLMRSLPFAKLREGQQVHWAWRMNGKDSAIFVIMVPVQVDTSTSQVGETLPDGLTQTAAAAPKRGVVVAFFSANPLAVVTEDFVGSSNTVFIVDDQGYVASHSNKAYNGSLFTEDDVVKEIRANPNRGSKSGNYENLDGDKVISRWERIEGSNLYAVVATPLAAIAAASKSTQKTMFFFGGVGTFFSMMLAFFLMRFLNKGEVAQAPVANAGGDLVLFPMTDSQETKTEQPAPFVASPAREKEEAKATSEVSTVPTDEAYRQLAQGLSRELRTPLAALLGHVKLLNEQGVSKNSHSEAIESEARHLKDVLEALTGVAGEDNLKMRPTSVSEIVQIAANNLEKEIGVAGATLKVEAERAPLVEASAVHLQKAIESICRQAIEALRTRPGGELRVRVCELENGKVRMQIRDSGIGMDRDQAVRYFEPFYQPYEGASNLGLSLAMAKALLEKHQGEVSVESVPGSGTTVTVDFPVSKEQVKAIELPNMAEIQKPVAIPPPPGAPPTLSFSGIDFATEEAKPIEAPSAPMKPMPSLTLGGKKPVAIGEELPLPPDPDAAGTRMAPAAELSPALRPPALDDSIHATDLPPMDLSRTEAPPEGMRELELPKFGIDSLADEPEPFASLSLNKSSDTEEAVDLGAVTGISQINESGVFRVKIRRPKPKGDV